MGQGYRDSQYQDGVIATPFRELNLSQCVNSWWQSVALYDSAAQSYLMFASRSTFSHRAASLRMNAATSSGVLVTAKLPVWLNFSRTSGSDKMCTTSRLSLSMIGRGVVLGATRPSQMEISSKFCKLAAAASVGTSG